jgi:formate dehydrogenase
MRYLSSDPLTNLFSITYQMIERGDWQVSDIARNAFDLEGKVVGTIGAGRIGYRVLQRLVPFDCKELLYYDYAPLPTGIVPTNLMFWYR